MRYMRFIDPQASKDLEQIADATPELRMKIWIDATAILDDLRDDPFAKADGCFRDDHGKLLYYLRERHLKAVYRIKEDDLRVELLRFHRVM